MKRLNLCTLSTLWLMTGAVIAQTPPNQPGHKNPAPGSNSEAMSATQDAVAGMVGQVSAEMTGTTKGFVTAAAISDMYEVEAGKLAAQRARSADVKAFARKMVEAHTMTTATLKGILAALKIAVTPPPSVDNRRQGMLDNLRGAAGADFDHRYVMQQVAAHREANILFRGYAKGGDNAAVKAFAAKTQPDIQMHLMIAEDLDKKIK